jgi:hypothetical protein
MLMKGFSRTIPEVCSPRTTGTGLFDSLPPTLIDILRPKTYLQADHCEMRPATPADRDYARVVAE